MGWGRRGAASYRCNATCFNSLFFLQNLGAITHKILCYAPISSFMRNNDTQVIKFFCLLYDLHKERRLGLVHVGTHRRTE